MKTNKTKLTKHEFKIQTHLTRPPRLEGKVKNTMMYSKKKHGKTWFRDHWDDNQYWLNKL